MKYKVIQYKSKDGCVYRKFHYSTKKLGIKAFISIVLLSISIFMLIPDISELVMYGAISSALCNIFNISMQQALVTAVLIYKIIGIILLASALILGGQYIKERLNRKMKFLKR